MSSNRLKVLIVNYSDLSGGAARAAYRLHKAFLKYGIDSRMVVMEKKSDDWRIFLFQKGWFLKICAIIRTLTAIVLMKLLKTNNSVLHSPSVLSNTNLLTFINDSDVDIVHLHWICGEMLSVEDIGKIKKPIVWTLHDMWAFCGAEHYTTDKRWIKGYFKHNRPDNEVGIDINKWIWNRKVKAWKKKDIAIVTPSKWLAWCARESFLMKLYTISVIPNALDSDVWKPVNILLARQLLNLPMDKKLILFGAMGGGKDIRKGIDLLLSALDQLNAYKESFDLVIFGESEPKNMLDIGFTIHYMGHLHDDVSLRLLYSACNCMVIPSRQDNLPNTGLEALSCGLPIVAFDTSGLPDLVIHHHTGYLAQEFDVSDLANGILWVLKNEKELREQVLLFFLENFADNTVVSNYLKTFESILMQKNKKIK